MSFIQRRIAAAAMMAALALPVLAQPAPSAPPPLAPRPSKPANRAIGKSAARPIWPNASTPSRHN
ncbi:hypothetical protein [Acidovorax carolinensis]|uniref:hypothetical protein n=1 Tax=Acidovorax carolinensis TaxID=553814 RepID=UPI001F207E5C|nr:hypothetical protein [Acidovorax carolinensis]